MLGALANLFAPFFLSDISVVNAITWIPNALRGFTYIDGLPVPIEYMPYLQSLLNSYLIFIIILIILLWLVPGWAFWGGFHAFKRRKDTKHVLELKICSGFMLVLAIVLYFLPNILDIPQDGKFLATSLLDVILPYSVPLNWGLWYALAAAAASKDAKIYDNTKKQSKKSRKR